MSLHYWFRNPSGTFEEITDRVRLPGPDRDGLDVTTNAEEATIASSELWVDDPNGDLIIGGIRRFYITEDAVASSSNQVVWNGYSAERTVSRGGFRTASGRLWKVALVDHNTILERRLLTASTANRPAETDVQRMQWVEATAAAGLIDDTQYLSTANGVAMDAADYRGQRVTDVVNDCMQASGKNAFLWLREEVTVDDGPGAISLFYDFPDSAVYGSPIHLTNIASEVDGATTFAISEDTELRRDPSRVYSGVWLQGDFPGGHVYEQRGATSTAFALGGRDTTALGENVKSVAKATARAQLLLEQFSTEEDVITTTVHRVPAALVNTMMAGMRIRFKATHLPGYQSEVYMRILNRNVVETSEEYFSIRMELGAGSAEAEDSTGGGSPVVDASAVINWSQDLNDGTGNLEYLFDGDNPHSGDPAEPKVGPVSYIGSVGHRTGLLITADNTVTIHFAVNWQQAYGDVHPFTIVTRGRVLLNGTTLAEDSQSQFFTGFPGSHGGTMAFTVSDVVVHSGDIITGTLQTTKDGVPVNDPGVPSGAGTGNNQLRVSAGSYA